ncbi:hypothetical protein GCM10010228_47100 [Streptomyces massasporeus]|nr:hypothetical protein GCM10010228_47100 [Streptomyces massasporeus]
MRSSLVDQPSPAVGKRMASSGISLGPGAMSWLFGYRRLSPRYERDLHNYLASLGLAAALCCYKRLIRLTA